MHTVCVSLRMGTAEKMASRGPGFIIIIIMCVTLPSQTPTLLTQMSIGVGRSFWLQPHMGCKWRSEFAIGMPWGRLLVPFCPSDPQPPPPPMPPLEVTGLPPCGIPGETSRRPPGAIWGARPAASATLARPRALRSISCSSSFHGSSPALSMLSSRFLLSALACTCLELEVAVESWAVR